MTVTVVVYCKALRWRVFINIIIIITTFDNCISLLLSRSEAANTHYIVDLL